MTYIYYVIWMKGFIMQPMFGKIEAESEEQARVKALRIAETTKKEKLDHNYLLLKVDVMGIDDLPFDDPDKPLVYEGPVPERDDT